MYIATSTGGVFESLDQGAPAAHLAAGICDAVSAGVLLYVALAELLPAMTASSWLRTRRWPLQARRGVSGCQGTDRLHAGRAPSRGGPPSC